MMVQVVGVHSFPGVIGNFVEAILEQAKHIKL